MDRLSTNRVVAWALAVLYLVAATLWVFLATASSAWWPWLLVGGALMAAAACGLVGLHRLWRRE